MKIIDLLKNSATSYPQRTVVKSGELELSYARILSDVYCLSKQLKLGGCRSGVKVAIALVNSAEYLTGFFAISAAGGTILPLSKRMTIYETNKYVKNADVSIVITDGIYGKRLLGELDNPDEVSIIHIQYESSGNLKIKMIASADCLIDEENEDVALMAYTSGTVGVPKIVMLTDEQLISNMCIYKALMEFDGHNIVYCALLLHHIYCICAQILTHISLADTFIINEGPFFIKDFLKSVESQKVTITAFVPYLAMLLAEFPEVEKFNLKSLRYVTLSGDKTPKSTYESLTGKYNHVQFINTYGMTEAGSRISIAAPSPDLFPIESVGTPMTGIQVKIMDDNENILPPEVAGEVIVKSSGIMKGYYKQPDLTSRTIVNRWLKTGDVGKLDEKGNLFLIGRKKDVIISGGENIYPAEIEECLLEHPDILEAAVVPKQNKRLQEIVCAFIVTKPVRKITTAEIIHFCKGRLSSYKIPQLIKSIKQIPRLNTSKTDRRALEKIAESLH